MIIIISPFLFFIVIFSINYAYAHVTYEAPYEEEISCDDNSFYGYGHYYYWHWCDYYYQGFVYKRYMLTYHTWSTQESVGESVRDEWFYYLAIKVNSTKTLLYERYPLANYDLTLYRGDKIRYHSNLTLIYETPYIVINGEGNYHQVIINDGIMNPLQDISIIDTSEDYYNINLNATISTNSNVRYGTYDIKALIYYQYPRYYRVHGYSCSDTCDVFDDEGVSYVKSSKSVTLTNTTIVPYDPVLKVYPYLSLADEEDWSFDKQLRLAIHYLGSKEGETIYNERRALINNDYNEEYVYQVLKGYDIIEDSKVKKILNEDIKYTAYNVTCANPIFNIISVIYAYDNNNDGYHDEFMLPKEGYYDLKLDYNASYMLDIINNQYADLTLYTTLKSNFAYENKDIANFTYIYPSRAFNARINVTVIDYNNNPSAMIVDKITLNFTRYKDAIPLYHYLYLRYHHDINDLTIVNSIMCLEDAVNTYLKDYFEAISSSSLIVDALYSSILIPDTALQFYNASDVYAIPLNYALTSLTPYNITITIVKNGIDYSNEYILPTLEQYSDYVYYVNVGSYHYDQYVKRFNDIIYIQVPNTFLIRDLFVHKIDKNNNYLGSDYYNNCVSGCIIVLQEEYSAWLLMTNEWHGRADAFVNAIPVSNTTVERDVLAIFILGSSVAIAILALLRKFWNEIT